METDVVSDVEQAIMTVQGVKEVSWENVDESSSPSQLQWFYSHTRAN